MSKNSQKSRKYVFIFIQISHMKEVALPYGLCYWDSDIILIFMSSAIE